MYYLIQLFSHSCRAERRLVKTAPPTAHKGRLLLTLLFMLLTVTTTWADNYVTLTSTTTKWTNGKTYETNGDVTIANRITVTGNVTLKLTDGYTLTAPNGIEVRYPNSLTIEGGTNGTGTLTIEKNEISKAGIGGGSGTYSRDPIIYGNITINGGIVNVKGGAYSAGIGGNNNSSIDGCGTITINGGIVNATGGTGAAGIGGGRGYDSAKGGCGNIVINGGQVTATGGYDGPGIGPGKGDANKTSGSLVLGWTNTTDFIKVTGVESNVKAYGFSNRLKSISFAEDTKFKIVGGGEATTENIKNKVNVQLIPKGSEQYQLSVATISGINASYDLTGSSLDIPFGVSDAEGNTLTLGTDYTATLGTTSQESTTIHITEGGKYTLTINGMGSYSGSKSVDFEVISIGFKKDANGVDYINMPKNGIKNVTIPSGVSSFKVYDDGGAKAKYSNSYDGGLVLTAPDNHVLQLTGTVTAEVQVNNPLDYLMVYDGGSTSAQKIGDKYGSDESGEDIDTLISSGKQMTLTFHSDNSGQRDGLDLTVTLKRDISSCVIADIDDQPYTRSAIKPDLVITYEGTALVKGVDYEVTYSNNTLVGTATITITGKGNYAKTTSKTFNIVKATPNVSAPAAVDNLIYSGKNQDLVVDGTTNFGTLLYSLDGENYSEDIPTATNAGIYTVYYKVEGSDNWYAVDAASVEAPISPKAVTNDDITIPSQVWTGSELTPVITVKDGETVLTENTDYTVIAPDGTIEDAGDYTYTITGKGNYSGEITATFNIDKATPYVKTAPTASAITYGQTLSVSELNDGVIQYSESIDTPVAGKFSWTNGSIEPSVADSENTEYEVTFTPKDSENYKSVTTNVTLKVNKATPTVTAPIANTLIYDGSEQELVAAGSTDFGPLLYSLDGENYSADIPTATNAGTYTVYYKVVADANHKDVAAATVKVTIAPKAVTVTTEDKTKEYGAADPELTATVAGLIGEDKITYTLSRAEGENADEYAITASGEATQGNYSVTYTGAKFTITKATVGLSWNTETFDYDGTEKAITATATGLKGNDECTVTLTDNTAIAVGKYTATATGLGNSNYKLPDADLTWDFEIVRKMENLFGDGCSWAGYVAQENLELPAGVEAYAITALGDATATATELGYIPEDVPVLLKRTDKTQNLYRASAGTGSAPATNLLQKASDSNQPTAFRDYVLYKDQFILIDGGTLADGKVFLPIPANNKSRAATRSIAIEGEETTGIDAIDNGQWTIDNWYSLDGRKLGDKPTKKGIYIHNGQKVIIK